MKEFIAVIALIALGLFLYTFTTGTMQETTEDFLTESTSAIKGLSPGEFAD